MSDSPAHGHGIQSQSSNTLLYLPTLHLIHADEDRTPKFLLAFSFGGIIRDFSARARSPDPCGRGARKFGLEQRNLMTTRRYSDKTLKLLFGSGKKCAFPGCTNLII